MLAVGLSYMAFIMLRYVPSLPILLSVVIINGAEFYQMPFAAALDMIMWFLFFILFMGCITFIDLQIFYQPHKSINIIQNMFHGTN